MNTIKRKMLFMLLVMFFISVNAYAGAVSSAGGELDLFDDGVTVDGGDGVTPIGLSPKVEAYYVSDGTDSTDSQWYAISSIHPGGNKVYGTAQDVNNVYSQDHATGTDLDTSLQKIPASPQSASDWSTNEWEL